MQGGIDMWKWTIKCDKSFETPMYRVKADGLIVGTIRKVGLDWSWEVDFPGQAPLEFCRGTRSTRDECQKANREAVQASTKGMTRDEVIGLSSAASTCREERGLFVLRASEREA